MNRITIFGGRDPPFLKPFWKYGLGVDYAGANSYVT